ncbi:MAG TPA: hypothetical protein ENN80_11865, partial [Candidatus Hydrogenedentes bacterium]|nr:hypothetical protein [Candidatus Hydrogenedentota bacterium]
MNTCLHPCILRITVGVGLAALLILASPTALADPTHYLQDGNGFWWDFDADGSVVDGSQTPVEDTDAFDWAMRLSVDGVAFPESERQVLDGRTVITGPETLNGLVVTRRAYVPDAVGEGWACFLEYIENPDGAPVDVTVRFTGNLGSDGDTTVTASSSGDAVFGPEDRWVASDDANDGGGDPSLCFNFWGAGAAVTPTDVYLPASQEDYYVDFLVRIPAESSIVLMHFCAQNTDDAAAAATAAYLDALPAAALVPLSQACGTVVNWDIPPDDLDVSPASTFSASGKHGGPFFPAGAGYTLTNNGATPLDWSALASEAWISVPPGGTLTPGSPQVVDVTLTAAADALAPGHYAGTATFTNDSSGASFVRTVQLTVEPRLVITTEDFLPRGTGVFVARGRPGGPFTPAGAVYTLTNVDDQVTDWSVTKPAWLNVASVPPLGAPLDPGESAQVFMTLEDTIAAGMALGNHADTVTFHNDTVAGTEVAVDVELRIHDVVFVDIDAPPAGDGSSWGTAFSTIQDGVDAADAATPKSWVFVAQGVYDETLTMRDGVEVFGGFAGTEDHLT